MPTTTFAGKSVNSQLIVGQWRDGKSEHSLANTNPYTDEPLLEIKQASQADVDEAYEAAKEAQVAWGQTGPPEAFSSLSH